jgi:hypothetical protein
MDSGVTAADVASRYRTRAQLAEIARSLGIATSGTKDVLLRRIIAALEAREGVTHSGDTGFEPPSTTRALPQQHRLTPPFGLSMTVPAGQPLTRELREWLTDQLGTRVRVTQDMRDFMKDPRGRTLQDLVDLARQPAGRRQQSEREIPIQFEFNRFLRLLSRQHPQMSRSERLDAWSEFRERTAEERAAFLGGDVLGGSQITE